MKDAALAALAVIFMGAILWQWGGPAGQDGDGYHAAYAGQPRSNCPPRRYRNVQSERPADYDDDGDAPRWERVQSSRPDYPQTDSRNMGVTTAYRRSE